MTEEVKEKTVVIDDKTYKESEILKTAEASKLVTSRKLGS